MGIERTSARRVKAVERELDRILARRDTLLYQAMRYTVLGGGKRFRPVFCLLTAAALAAGGIKSTELRGLARQLMER